MSLQVPPPQRSFSIGSDLSALARAAAACQAGFARSKVVHRGQHGMHAKLPWIHKVFAKFGPVLLQSTVPRRFPQIFKVLGFSRWFQVLKVLNGKFESKFVLVTKFQLRFELQSLEQIEIPSQGSREFKWYFRVDRSQQDKASVYKFKKTVGSSHGFVFKVLNWDYQKHRLPVKWITRFVWRMASGRCRVCFLSVTEKAFWHSKDPVFFIGFYGVFTGNQCFLMHVQRPLDLYRWIPMSHVFVTSGFHH